MRFTTPYGNPSKIWDANVSQCMEEDKGYCLCWVAIFADFQIGLIFEYYLFLRTVFCIEQLQCLVGTLLVCFFFAFLMFDPK